MNNKLDKQTGNPAAEGTACSNFFLIEILNFYSFIFEEMCKNGCKRLIYSGLQSPFYRANIVSKS